MPRTTLIGRVTAVTTAGALALTACTGGGTELQPEETGVAESEQHAEDPEVEPAWRALTTGDAALPENRTLTFAASLPGERGRPVLRGGSVAPPGEPARAAVWTLSPDGLGRPQRLEVEESSAVTAFAADADTTLAAGGAWADGERVPFLLRSADRESWRPVELPGEMDERGLGVDEVALTGDGTPLLAAVDAEDQPVVVDVDSGELIDLPVPDRVERVNGFTALLSADDRAVALAAAELPGGARTVVAYHSEDGETWEEAGALAGEQPTISGAVAVAGGFLATGHRVQQGEVTAAAWFSPDGESWEHEAVPDFPEHTSGWDTWLADPTAKGRRAWVGYSDERRLHHLVLERNGQGRWSTRAETRPWRTPGVELAVEVGGVRPNAAHVHTLRSWNGHTEAGYQPPGGRWRVTAEPRSAASPVGWWESVEQDGDALALVAGRSEVRTQGQAWTRRTVLTPFRTADDTLRRGRWQPPRSRDFTNIARATDADGATVLMGDRFFPSDDPEESNEADLVGWFRPRPQADWRAVRGVEGPRTEFLNGLDVHDGRWVAVGVDREASEHTASYRGAVWTSANGRRWQRQRGGFEVGDAGNSQFHDSCTLPGGDLLVVGAAEDPRAGSSPLAFRHDGDGWSRVTLGLLDTSASLRRCAVIDETVLVQGQVGQESVLWSAPVEQRLEFIRVPVATGHDTLGEIRRVEGGLAAPGSVRGGRTDEPVLWLSADGMEWHPTPVPASRPLDAEAVVEHDGELTVALTGGSGPGAWTLENPGELLADLAEQVDAEEDGTEPAEDPDSGEPAVPGD